MSHCKYFVRLSLILLCEMPMMISHVELYLESFGVIFIENELSGLLRSGEAAHVRFTHQTLLAAISIN